MSLEISATQLKRVNKIVRLKEYFKTDCPEIYEWEPEDEGLDFSIMSDPEVEVYLKRH